MVQRKKENLKRIIQKEMKIFFLKNLKKIGYRYFSLKKK